MARTLALTLANYALGGAITFGAWWFLGYAGASAVVAGLTALSLIK